MGSFDAKYQKNNLGAKLVPKKDNKKITKNNRTKLQQLDRNVKADGIYAKRKISHHVDTNNIKHAAKLAGAMTFAFTGMGLVWFWHHLNK